ncbi:histone acetyltransferase 1 [Tilletia horrida]|nr:histone acetyltransferase 1 [Tilletia horrida]
MADSWSSNTNAATELKLIGAPPPTDEVFNPEFTYPIFGESETVFGYTGLRIQLGFASGSLRTGLKVSYSAKNTSTTAQLDDVEGTLRPFLPPDVVGYDELLANLEPAESEWTPIGDKTHEYTWSKKASKGKAKASQFGRAGAAAVAAAAAAAAGQGSSNGKNGDAKHSAADERTFVIYRATWQTPGFREYHRRMQIFALFNIEAASYLHEDEDNWEFYTLFQRTEAEAEPADAAPPKYRYHFVGYTALYRFWCYPEIFRIRLAQFVILPPYQSQGHGPALFSHVTEQMQSRPEVCELTVEDPSEAFDRMRDGADLRRLLVPGGFEEQALKEGKLAPPLDTKWSEQQRRKYKIAGRQWARLIEMFQLRHLNMQDAGAVRRYRLQVKNRLYKFNRDVLTQMEKGERVQALQKTFASLISEEYAEILGIDVGDVVRDDGGFGSGGANPFGRAGGSSGPRSSLGRHPAIAEGDEEEEEEIDTVRPRKAARLE